MFLKKKKGKTHCFYKAGGLEMRNPLEMMEVKSKGLKTLRNTGRPFLCHKTFRSPVFSNGTIRV